VFERSSESDTESTVSTVGEEADRHIEAPFAAEYNGLLGRLVRPRRFSVLMSTLSASRAVPVCECMCVGGEDSTSAHFVEVSSGSILSPWSVSKGGRPAAMRSWLSSALTCTLNPC